MSVLSLEEDIFDPFKGYEDEVKYYENYGHSKQLFFDFLSPTTLARNAYYQGYITEWELRMIPITGVFHITGSFSWNPAIFLHPELTTLKGFVRDASLQKKHSMVLSKQRMLDMRINSVLGINNYQTTYLGMETTSWA